MSKLERLLNLTAALLHATRPLSADQIRRVVPGYPESDTSFHRSFERDKDDLRDMGIPIRLERILDSDPPIDGYRIPADEYYLADPELEPDELAALHLAASVVDLGGHPGGDAIWKLGGVVESSPADNALRAALPGDPRLAQVFNAVMRCVTIEFDYRGDTRRLDPHQLAFQRGRWYLRGYDHDRVDQREFRIDRISGDVLLTDDHFERTDVPATEHTQPWQIGDEEEISARLLVDAAHAGWAVHHVGMDLVEEQRGDGSVVLEVPVTNREAFRSFVLTFLDHAEILGPDELRDDLVAWLEGVAS